METVSDDQSDANSVALAQIELEAIAPLEQGFVKFDALKVDRARLESEVKRAAGEENTILNDEDLSERDAVKRLLEVRARFSVQNARLGAAERRVQEQRFALLECCSVMRRRLGTVVYYLRTARVKRATAIFEDLIEGPVRFGSVGIMDLVRRVKFVRQIDQVVNRISTGQNVDPQVELDTLRQLARQWFEEVRSLVLTEPGFSLQDFAPKQVPAEGESELAEVEQPGELVEA
jgi:hypothetical protein